MDQTGVHRGLYLRWDRRHSSPCFRLAVARKPKALQSATRNAVCVASNTLIETQRSNRAQEISSSKALQATIDNFHLEQRAWLQIGNWSFVMNDKTTPSYQALIFDSGKTPAIDVTTLI